MLAREGRSGGHLGGLHDRPRRLRRLRRHLRRAAPRPEAGAADHHGLDPLASSNPQRPNGGHIDGSYQATSGLMATGREDTAISIVFRDRDSQVMLIENLGRC